MGIKREWVIAALPDAYDVLLGELYDAAIDDHSWSRYLGHVRELFKANYATLIIRAPENSDKGLMVVSGDIEGEGSITYIAYPHTQTPFINCPVNQVFTVTDMMSYSTWLESDYYRTHCLPQHVLHVMGVDIALPVGGVFRFRITRPEDTPDFSEADKQLCHSLIPHMTRALQIHNLLGHKESLNTLYAQTIGRLSIATLVLDEHGSIVEANQIAREILATGDGLKVVGGRLEANYPGDNKRLYQALRSALAVRRHDQPTVAEALSVARPSGQVSLGLIIEPVPDQEWDEGQSKPSVIVYVRDALGRSILSSAMTRQLFGFTPSETSLALELANGLSLEDAAASLGIRRNTARAHLRAIFSKTGVRRQTELVRLILNSVASLGQQSDATQPLNEVRNKKT
ncbi:helix-turn-helix transcriptional regulator [Pseudomonas marincola]|uniref:helix-turn-helix transcriptional regulator n=1 Tax=Pseudomonas marincola TaxID=437900 RepID=UPI000AA964DD|nr:helix-turn-helix transcriptional regulator [Pseudomonas marincola]